MAAILKVWRRIRNPIPSSDAASLEEQSSQISSRSDLKRLSLRLFGNRNKNNNNNNNKKHMMIGDMGSGNWSDPKI